MEFFFFEIIENYIFEKTFKKKTEMRIVTKGGVWKNTEDEILKAAVMKYGKNQWARISSLLVRKTAKQCKARWYEWLDPSIKKTEWSREEEEKLLHLAKIMPNQWKTIAPIIGRTASQCIEHYEKLLDLAQNKGEEYDPTEDPRRLRPGEIDPNPESKPARPDPIDMDEDEKEMLSEARARLANTKGKKAKRKAREKQLEEARRLAALQKRRELKAAGIDLPKAKKKIKGIDYNSEIPFHKRPPPGVFEVDYSNEKAPEFKPVNLDQLEGKRKREDESGSRQEDVKRQKKKAETDLPSFIEQISKLNELKQNRPRFQMNLPSPQLSDSELEEISKLSSQETPLPELDSGNQITRSLLPDLAPTPLNLPIRTPVRTPLRENTVKKEVEALKILTQAPTPLHGESTLQPNVTSDFSGATPRPSVVSTPNPLLKALTPLRNESSLTTSNVVPSSNNLKTKNLSSTPFRTPLRDQLHINEGQVFEDPNLEKKQQGDQRKSLLEGLKKLPAPKNEYSIELPELPEEELEENEDTIERDASDLMKEKLEREKREEERKLRLRSQVLKRNLPRPTSLSTFTSSLLSSSSSSIYLKQAEDLLFREIVSYLIHDSQEVPFQECQIKGPLDKDWYSIDESLLNEAQNMLQQEVQTILQQNSLTFEDLEQTWSKFNQDWFYLPSQKKFVPVFTMSSAEKLEAYNFLYQTLRNQMEKESAQASKMESKVQLYFAGYQKRSELLKSQLDALLDQMEQAETELECFKRLQEIESYAMQNRVESLRKDVDIQEKKEEEKQNRYRELTLLFDELLHKKK